jgi:hypothetical protein
MRFLISSFLALLLISGCARSPVVQEAPVTRIMVIPVMPIAKLHTENKGVPLGVLWYSIADRIKSSDFSERMEVTRKDMGPKLTAALVRQLNAQGFEAQVLEGVARPAASPDRIDYQKLPATDPVLHVYFDEVGMYSARFSKDYVPRVNVGAYMVRPRSEVELYNETIYYGADASGNSRTSVPADARHHWSSFDEIIGKPQEVAGSYDDAVNALAAKIAQNIRAQAGTASGQPPSAR